MRYYAKIENTETYTVSVGTGTNSEFYESIGMELMDVERGYDEKWYLAGYAPKKPQELIEKEAQKHYTDLIQSILDKEAQALRL